MPFTLAHAAAALPFRRTRLIPAALVAGTFAPDFMYFIRLAPHGHFGHTLPGAVLFSLPAALIVLWLFDRFVKAPLVLLLPDPFQQRLVPHMGRFIFFPISQLALVALSILAGIATHLAWDSFTHPGNWLYDHWSFLGLRILIPGVGPIEYCRIFQHISTVVGITILLLWGNWWYRAAKPAPQPLDRQLTQPGRVILLAVAPALAIILGILRAYIGARLASTPHSWMRIIGDAVVTSIALYWWQFVLCGWLVDHPFFSKSRARVKTS